MLDYGEVVVHLMFAFERDHYNLEGKFSRAVQVRPPCTPLGSLCFCSRAGCCSASFTGVCMCVRVRCCAGAPPRSEPQ